MKNRSNFFKKFFLVITFLYSGIVLPAFCMDAPTQKKFGYPHSIHKSSVEKIIEKLLYKDPTGEEEEELKRNFSLFRETFSITNLLKILLEEYREKEKVFKWCSKCGKAKKEARFALILDQLSYFLRFLNQEKQVVHTEFGEEGCFQIYLLTVGLLNIGYKKIELNLIGLSKDLKKYGELAQEKLSILANEKNATVRVNIYANGVQEYIDRVGKEEAPRSHSFGMVDPSPWNMFHIFKHELIKKTRIVGSFYIEAILSFQRWVQLSK